VLSQQAVAAILVGAGDVLVNVPLPQVCFKHVVLTRQAAAAILEKEPGMYRAEYGRTGLARTKARW
jgi:hypothetical protein